MKNAPPPGAPYRAYTNLLWAECRRRYLEGEHAPALCAEFGLSLGTFYSKSRKEGWRKKDNPAPSPPPSPGDAADQAIRAAQMASARGDFREAENQSRIAERFSRMAQRAGTDLTKVEREPGAPCPLCGAAAEDGAADDGGEAFRRDLEDRINRVRLEERRGRDAMKTVNPADWERQYAAARERALAQVAAEWEGDARLFHPEAPEPGADGAQAGAGEPA